MTAPRSKRLPRGISMEGELFRVRVSWRYKQLTIGRYESLAIAKLALGRARAEIVMGTFVPPAERRRRIKAELAAEAAEGVTVAEWSTLWLDRLAADPERPRSPGTITAYRSTLNAHVLNALGSVRLIDVTSEHIDSVISTSRAAGPSAARNVARTVRAMFNAAVLADAGGLKMSPVKVRLGDGGKGSRRREDEEIPSTAEVRALIAAMTPELRLVLRLMAAVGLRPGEVLGLQRRDFVSLDDPAAAQVRIRRQWLSKARPPAYSTPKDDSIRDLSLPTALVPLVVAHLDAYVGPEPDAPVFPSPRNPERPCSHNVLGVRWREAAATVRPGLHLYTLRHYHLTEYARAGATQTETQRRGGHRDAESASRYQHGSVARDHTLAEAFNDLIEGPLDVV